MPKESRPSYFNQWDYIWENMQQFQEDHDISPLVACLCFVLSYDKIDRVIVGVNSVKQLKEILEGSEVNLLSLPNNLAINDTALTNPSKWELT